ncbi:MAG: glycosyltransferase family 87 protein [Chloroflexota bacterium]
MLWLLVTFLFGRASQGWREDLLAYTSAAHRYLDGMGMYQVQTLSGPFKPGPIGLYLYAPSFALAMVPLALAGTLAGPVWWLIHLAAVAGAAGVMPVRREIRLGVFVVAVVMLPVLKDMTLGNVSVLVLFLAAVAWRWRGSMLGGVALGLSLFIRPPMAVIVAWALIRRHRRLVLGSIVTGGILVIASLPFVGIRGWLDYLTVLRNVSGVDSISNNLALGAVASRYGAGDGLATALLVVGYLVAIVAIGVGLRRDAEVSLVVTITATLLLGPLMWEHYLTLLLLPAALLAERGHPSALALPLLVWLQPPFTPFVVIAALLLPLLLPVAHRASVTGTPPIDVPVRGDAPIPASLSVRVSNRGE